MLHTSSSPFEGISTALITPFRPDLSLDLECWDQLIDRQENAGTQAIVVGGSTGEGQVITRDEWRHLLERSLKRVKKTQVVASCGTSSTQESCERAKIASSLGVAGLLVSSPPYNKPPQRGLIAHFEAVAASSSVALMLYNIPGRSAVNLNAETLQTLWKNPKILSIKESSGQLDQALQMLRDLPAGKSLLSGDDAWAYPLMASGASGLVSVMANLFPRLTQKIYQQMKRAHFEHAHAIHQKLMQIIPSLFVESNPIPVKWCMGKILGRDLPLRLPLVTLDEKYQASLGALLTQLRREEEA